MDSKANRCGNRLKFQLSWNQLEPVGISQLMMFRIGSSIVFAWIFVDGAFVDQIFKVHGVCGNFQGAFCDKMGGPSKFDTPWADNAGTKQI